MRYIDEKGKKIEIDISALKYFNSGHCAKVYRNKDEIVKRQNAVGVLVDNNMFRDELQKKIKTVLFCFLLAPESYAPRFTWYVFSKAIISGVDDATIFLPADSKSIRESGKMLKISARKGIQSISTTPNDGLKVEITQGTYCLPHYTHPPQNETVDTPNATVLQCYSSKTSNAS